MIAHDTRIYILDTSKRIPHAEWITVQDLFQQYASPDDDAVTFPETMKIQDGMGWTHLVAIHRKIKLSNWYQFWPDEMNRSLTMTMWEPIPLVNLGESSVGPHHRAVHPVTLHELVAVTGILAEPKYHDFKIRCRFSQHSDQDIGLRGYTTIRRMIELPHQQPGTNGYIIMTQSQFYNGSGLWLYGGPREDSYVYNPELVFYR